MTKKSSPVDMQVVKELKTELFGDCLNVEEVALILDVTRETVLHYLKDGRVGGFKMGRRYYIPVEELSLYAERLKAGQMETPLP